MLSRYSLSLATTSNAKRLEKLLNHLSRSTCQCNCNSFSTIRNLQHPREREDKRDSNQNQPQHQRYSNRNSSYDYNNSNEHGQGNKWSRSGDSEQSEELGPGRGHRPRPHGTHSQVGKGHDILPSPSSDPDTFGTIAIQINRNPNLELRNSNNNSFRFQELRNLKDQTESIFEVDEEDDSVFIPERPNRWSSPKLRKVIMELVEQKKLKEALDTFYGALEQGGFSYDLKHFNFIYTLLISECGKVGYVQMAFKLYHDMRARCGGANIPIEPHAFTGLLNACANAHWKELPNDQRLEKIGLVRSIMSDKGILPNTIHYNVLIKAYGRAGNIAAAFAIVDEMLIARRERPKEVFIGTGTFAFLLQACASNRQNGFRYAILTLQKLREMKIRPSIYTYNLFLRVTRDCGIQQLEQLQQLEEKSPSTDTEEAHAQINSKYSSRNELNTSQNQSQSQNQLFETNLKYLDTYCKDLETVANNNSSSASSLVQLQQMQQEQDFELPDLSVPENRFAALGGLRAFVRQLQADRVKPDLKTLTQLTEIVHPDQLQDILMLLNTNNIQPDIDFFNLVMKRFILWKEHDLSFKATEILQLLPKYQVSPNIMTWGILALKCKSWAEADELLKEMDEVNVVPNYQIMGAFQTNALKSYDPKYMIRVMETVLRREIPVNQEFFDSLIKFKNIIQNAILNDECGKPVAPWRLSNMIQSDEFKEYWQKFKLRYKAWYKNMESQGLKDKEEDGNQFQEDFKDRISKIKEKKMRLKNHNHNQEAVAAAAAAEVGSGHW